MWSLVFTHQFNGDSAFVYIQKQCDFGPRYPGSDAHKIFSEFLYTFFNKYSDSIQEYNDTIIHPIKEDVGLLIADLIQMIYCYLLAIWGKK